MDKDLTKLMQQAQEASPEFRQMAEYLMSRRRMPEMRAGYIADDTTGRFVKDLRSPGPGTITISNPRSESALNTLMHELAHAVEYEIDRQRYVHRRNAIVNDFTQTYDKLNFDGSKPVGKGNVKRNLVDSFPDGAQFRAQEQDYRASDRELTGHAVGNAVGGSYTGSDGWKAPLHVDPTVATQFMILLDAALTDSKKNPPPQGR